MKKQDLVSIGITFFVGVAGGMYLYMTGFAGLVANVSVPDEESLLELSITADMYGGCKTNCSSFRVLSDGSYKVLRAAGEDEKNMIEGTLPLMMQKEMRDVIDVNDLADQSEPFTPTNCSSYTDGIDAVYEITIDEESFVIDSCGTKVDGGSDLWLFLNELWTYFDNI